MARFIGEQLLEFAFVSQGLARVWTHHRSDNIASAAILRKLGFSAEGQQPGQVFYQGKRYDTIYRGISAADYQAHRASEGSVEAAA